MNIPTDIHSLARLFEMMGASDPEDWARSQIEEGIPQVARFLFLRQAWRQVVSEEDPAWIDAAMARSRSAPNAPFAGIGRALSSLRAKGASDDELTDLVRGMQAELLLDLCYLLEDPGSVEDAVSEIEWVLAQIDSKGKVVSKISGLHESVLETDPSGREMRPRSPG